MLDDAAYLLQGFSFRWEEHPHRVRALGVVVETEPESAAGEVRGALDLTCRGGSWTTGERARDRARWQADLGLVASPALRFHHGVSGLLAGQGEAGWRRRRPAEAAHRVVLDLAELGRGELAEHDQVAVVLRGFELEADPAHPHGFTAEGLGVRLDQVERLGTRLSFRAWASLRAGGVPDRRQRLSRYGFQGRVHYTLVGLGPEGRCTRARHLTRSDEPAGLNPTRPRLSHPLTLAGAPGLAFGQLAWAGFELTLNAGRRVWPGRYLREVSLRLGARSYEPSSGRADCSLEAYFSNQGLISWGTRCELESEVLLLQSAAADALQRDLSHEGTPPDARHRAPLVQRR